MNSEFWKDKKVLVTGHTGFKGSWLCIWLKGKGADIIGYSLPPPSEPSLFDVARIGKSITSVLGDVRDVNGLQKAMADHKPEIVIHMAAQSLVRYSYENPVETYETNVMGTMNILEAVRKMDRRPRVVLIITSDKCYDNKEWLWGYRETDPMGGCDPYSSSKACAELVTAAYRSSFFPNTDFPTHHVAVATARAGNVIGGGDWGRNRLVPDIMEAVTKNQSLVIRNPNAIRPWQHVLEPLDGYLCLIEELWEHGPEYVGGWNFGPDDQGCKPVSWVVQSLKQCWGDTVTWELDSGDNPHEASCLKLDCSKAKRLLKWSPKLDLTKALEWVVDWYRAYVAKSNMHEFSSFQITQYEEIT